MNLLEKNKFDELKAAGTLPSPKGVALAIVQLTRKDDVSVSEIVHTLKADPALAGRVIKAANTANKARRPVASMPDAVAVIGINAVRNLALGFSLVSHYSNGSCRGFDYPRYWSRSLLVANAAPSFGGHVNVAAGEELFICGLFGRIGQLALATVYPDAYSKLLQQNPSVPLARRRAAEREQFGISDDELAAQMITDWGMPRQLADPVRFHESTDAGPFPEGSRGAMLCSTMRLAAYFADLTFMDPVNRRRQLPQLFLLASRLGMDSDTTLALGDEAVRQWHEWGAMLKVDSSSVESYVELARAAPAAEAEAVSSVTPTLKEESKPAKELVRVLVVEKDAALRRQLAETLRVHHYEVANTHDVSEGLSMALQFQPHIVIADSGKPGMDGMALCKALRETTIGRHIYLLLLSSQDSEQRLVEAFESGVDDYLAKPVKEPVLLARLRAGERVVRMQREMNNDRDEIRRLAAEMATINRKLREVALMDSLTGIPNRGYAMERLDHDWAAARRQQSPLACIMVDIDHFKRINDEHGHAAGDTVLKQAAQIMRQSARAQDVVCRIGGEEFLVICPASDTVAAYLCAERLRTALAGARFEVGQQRIPVTISLGVAALNARMSDVAMLMREADRALYLAKEGGRNRCVVAEAGSATAARRLTAAS